MYRQPAGQSGWDFRLYNEECDKGDYASSCFSTRTGHPAIFLGLLHRNYKVPVSHEMGHFLAYLENGYRADIDYEYVTSDPDCDDDPGASHGRRTQEWQNAAAWEGFANFYSATVWNNTGQSDCEFNNNFDCAINEKHLETECDLPIACTGTDGDWMQFWWNVMRDEGLSVSQINNIYDEADPQNWSDPCTVYMDLGLAASSLDYMRILYWLIYGDYYGINH